MAQYPADMGMTQLSPHSVEAEEAVLGAILINPEALFEVLPFLRAEDFFVVRHQWIWDALIRIHERRDPLDYLTLVSELEQVSKLAETGGAAYILSLINKTPSALNVEGYGRIVERMALRRRLIDAAQTVVRVAHSDETDIDEVIGKAEQSIFEVTERRLAHDLIPIKQAVSEYFDHISYIVQHQDAVLGVPTGFIDIDRLLGGFQKSDLVIIAARPGMGKSSMLNSLVMNAARLDQRVALFTLEMSNEQLVQRFVSTLTNIPSHKLREGKLDDRDWAAFIKATEDLSSLPIYLDDTPSITTHELRSKARRLHLEFGLDMIVLDYLQLMTTPNKSENRVQEISYISRALKQIARELNVPVISAAQLSRAVEQRTDKRPQLSDLRESGCLAGDTRIYVPEIGQYIPIRDLMGHQHIKVASLDTDTWKLQPATVSRSFCTGTKPVFRLTTQVGRSIRATANHKFLTMQGWKRLDELTLEDRIALPRNLTVSTSQTLSNAQLALLAHLIGDGCTLPTHAVQYTTREYDLAQVVANLSNQVFPGTIKPRIQSERTWYQVYLSPTQHLTHGVRNPVGVWLEELGLWGQRSFEKFVPQEVFSQPDESIAVFLKHLWATDGCIKVSPDTYPQIYYATSSRALAVDVQSLLLRLGINARLKRVSQKEKGRDQFHVIITGHNDLERFVEIGAAGAYKQHSLKQVAEYISLHPANTNRDIIPRSIWRQMVVPAMQANNITSRQMQAGLGNAYCGTGLYKQNLSREKAARLADIVMDKNLACLATSDIYWDNIASIEEDGLTDVYDLTVPGLHNFVAEDIIVHNSIEQDSDVVMFIYRDSYYNPDSPEGLKAEISIAKHRNGPTGTVDLVFIPELTQFQNATTTTYDLDRL
jgi:replicative DNA helicase